MTLFMVVVLAALIESQHFWEQTIKMHTGKPAHLAQDLIGMHASHVFLLCSVFTAGLHGSMRKSIEMHVFLKYNQ
jgi:hypothetical protein